MKIDANQLTLNDLKEVEKLSGGSLQGLAAGEMSADMLIALVFVVKRREDPGFSLEDAGNVRIGDLEVEFDADPTG